MTLLIRHRVFTHYGGFLAVRPCPRCLRGWTWVHHRTTFLFRVFSWKPDQRWIDGDQIPAYLGEAERKFQTKYIKILISQFQFQKSGLVGQSSYKTLSFGFENSSKLSRSMQDDLLLLKSWRLKNTFGIFWDPMQSFAKAQFGASEFAGWRFWPKVSQLEFFSMKKSCDVDCPAVDIESGRTCSGRSSYT